MTICIPISMVICHLAFLNACDEDWILSYYLEIYELIDYTIEEILELSYITIKEY